VFCWWFDQLASKITAIIGILIPFDYDFISCNIIHRLVSYDRNQNIHFLSELNYTCVQNKFIKDQSKDAFEGYTVQFVTKACCELLFFTHTV